jgi:hypothetical protein
VTESIVDGFEIVDIPDQHGQGFPEAFPAGIFLRRPFVIGHPVG